jgi:hypothetical protein
MTLSDWIQIGIAFIAFLGVMAALLTAIFTWRSRALLLATKEKHSTDLMGILETWMHEITEIIPDDKPPFNESALTTSLSIENHILFTDLKNHLPPELGISDSWNIFKDGWQDVQKRKASYLQAIEDHLESASKLKLLTWKEENGCVVGITHGCVEWLYTSILSKARGNDIYLPNLITSGDLIKAIIASNNDWAYTGNPTMFISMLTTIIINVQGEQSNTKEFDLLKKARGLWDSQLKLESLKETLLNSISEARAIPILTGRCKHLDRAMEPIFQRNPHPVLGFRRFAETASLAVVFLTFSVVLISIINMNNIWTFNGIILLVLAMVSFILFIIFSIGLLDSRVMVLYEKMFEQPRPWVAQVFIDILWLAIVIGFLAGLFYEKLPQFLYWPAMILAIVWGIYVIFSLSKLRFDSQK